MALSSEPSLVTCSTGDLAVVSKRKPVRGPSFLHASPVPTLRDECGACGCDCAELAPRTFDAQYDARCECTLCGLILEGKRRCSVICDSMVSMFMSRVTAIARGMPLESQQPIYCLDCRDVCLLQLRREVVQRAPPPQYSGIYLDLDLAAEAPAAEPWEEHADTHCGTQERFTKCKSCWQ